MSEVVEYLCYKCKQPLIVKAVYFRADGKTMYKLEFLPHTCEKKPSMGGHLRKSLKKGGQG